MRFFCFDFINSQWYNTHKLFKEPLEDPIWIATLLNKWDIIIDFDFTKDNLSSLLELRSQLTDMVEKIVITKALSPSDINFINKYLSLSNVKQKLTYNNKIYLLELIPIDKDFNWLVSQIVASFAKLLTEYDIERIKICENVECKWVFYDESRSRTRRWCDSSCGNLMKVRRFRERQKNKNDNGS